MASWQTEATQSTFQGSAASENLMGQRGRDSNGAQNNWNFAARGFGFGYDVVGIDAKQARKMRDAIVEYTTNLETYLNGLNPEANAGVAFAGEEIKKAIKAYIEKTKEYAVNLTSTMIAFSDKLQDIANAWEKAEQSNAGTVQGAAGAFSAGTKYTETL